MNEWLAVIVVIVIIFPLLFTNRVSNHDDQR